MTTIFIIIGIFMTLGVIATAVYYISPKAKEYMDENILNPLSQWVASRRTTDTDPTSVNYSQQSAFNAPATNLGAPLNLFATVFGWYGGADLALLRGQPSSIIAKRAGFGFAMFFTIAFGAIIAGIVWTDIQGPVFGIFTGLTWFVLISAIDRLIMIFTDHFAAKKGHWVALALIVLLRLVMIFAVPTFNSIMIEMKVFDAEIKADIAGQRNMKLNHLNDVTKKEVQNIQDQKDELQKEYNSKNTVYLLAVRSKQSQIDSLTSSLMTEQKTLQEEIAGRVGSGKFGDGPVAKSIREGIKRDSAMRSDLTLALDSSKRTMPEYIALQQAQADKINGWKKADIQIAQIYAEQKIKAAELNSIKMDGFIDRYHALDRVSDGTMLVGLFYFIFLVFEAVPIVAKLIMGSDSYTNALRIQIQKHEVEHQQEALLQIERDKNLFILNMSAQRDQGLRYKADANNSQTAMLGNLSVSQINHAAKVADAVKAANMAVDTHLNGINMSDELKQLLQERYVNEIANS